MMSKRTRCTTLFVAFIFSLLVPSANAKTETALVINKDGLGVAANFGEVVNVTVSNSGVLLEGELFPGFSFAFKNGGCFEVGIEEGLGSVFKHSKFERHRLNREYSLYGHDRSKDPSRCVNMPKTNGANRYLRTSRW